MSRPSRREFLAAGFGAAPLFAAKKRPRPDKNVLFIALDDLRPDLGCYGHPEARTPNIDRIARRGLTFLRAYCQQAASSPSRTSLMSGLRPDTTRVHDRETHLRRYRPDAVTLPELFKRHGYETTAFGKIYGNPRMDDRPSWSIPPWIAGNGEWGSAENRAFAERNWSELKRNGWRSSGRLSIDRNQPSWEAPDAADNELPDGMTAEAAVAAMRELKGRRRFFLAVGFLRPHLPFVAPRRYYDLYPLGRIKASPYPDPPRGAPPYALDDSAELRGYKDIPAEGPIAERKQRELIRGYYASISYADAQVGRLLDALEALGLADDTVVCLWGDHGYHLGEHGLWTKHTNFEAAVHAPLIVSCPGQRNRGRKTRALTELVDIYPSLCDICHVPIPDGLEGSSFTPLFDDPERIWKRAAFSQYPRLIPGVGEGVGRSLRTDRYRYTEWAAEESPYKASELYDYRADPHETRNIALLRENVSLVNGLAGMLQQGWMGSLPPTDPRSSEES